MCERRSGQVNDSPLTFDPVIWGLLFIGGAVASWEAVVGFPFFGGKIPAVVFWGWIGLMALRLVWVLVDEVRRIANERDPY